ncbi:C6 transcription factor [Fusarium oxysporum f. sp. phaseoli]
MRHGFEIFDPLMLQFHSFVGFMALKELSDGREKPPGLVKALQSTLALATLGLRDQGKNSYLGDTIFRILRDMAASKHALPANEIIAMSKEDEDTKAEIAEHINSQFPINVVSIADDPEPHRVESLISQYKEIELDNESDRSEMGCSPRDC